MPGIDGRKMSKSYGNTIEMFADGKAIKKTVMGIVTDSTPVEEPKDPTTRRSSAAGRCSRPLSETRVGRARAQRAASATAR